MKISIIIPVYNCERYIAQALDCLRYQTFKNLEVIIVLDGCTDGTESIVKTYKGKLDLKIIKLDENHGLSVARNAACKKVTGDFIHFMDADDIVSVNFYQEMISAATHADADIAMSSFANERMPKDSVIYDAPLVLCEKQDMLDYTQCDRHGFSPRFLIRRQFWKKNNFAFPEDMRSIEDLALMIKVIYAAERLVLTPLAVYFYKFRANSIITSQNPESIKQKRNNRKKATLAVKQFLQTINLSPSKKPIYSTKYKLFGKIPIAETKFLTDRSTLNFYVFGILIFSRKFYTNNNMIGMQIQQARV